MNKAKQAVNSFMSKAGHHDTTVHESVAPSVQKETVNEHVREERQVAKDREVHQDHHHTTIQPVKDQEVLAEQHHHNMAGVEHRTHDHRNHGETKERLQAEAAQFKNESVRSSAQHTTSNTVPEVAGEHVHHHVHEKIQPVIHKETIEPHVIHTTVPVHEKHFNAPEHHSSTALPAINMSDFKKQGGSLTGGHEQRDHFQGEPQSIGKGVGSGHTGSHHTGNVATDAARHATSGTQQGTTGTHHDAAGSHAPAGTHNGPVASHGTKPSLMDKLNPMKDSDGDGKKGFMK